MLVKAMRTQLIATACSMMVSSMGAAQLIHLWDFKPGAELVDSVGGLHLDYAPGEGDIGGVFGVPGDVGFEPGVNGIGQAYRPYYIDPTASSTAGIGLTGSGFSSPSQFTIEAIVLADPKTSSSAVNYIFQTRPSADRGYFLIQDEDNLRGTPIAGIGSIIGDNFGDVEIFAEYETGDEWIYVAAVIDLTNAGTAVADLYSANISNGEMVPSLIVDDYTWNTASPNTLVGFTGIFGIGDFAIDRGGDGVAEASQEWFQGAIDYVAIYNGLLTPLQLEDNLRLRLEPPPPSPLEVPGLSPVGLMALSLLLVVVASRRMLNGT